MRSILVSGGTGSFGSTFIRHLCTTTTSNTWRRIICYSRDELKQSELQRDLADDRLRWFLGDIRDKDRLSLALRDVQVVVHACAQKRVESCESNPMEAVKTNILGSMNVVEAAIAQGVERVIALSSDKAVEAVNLYGQSKAAMERLMLAANSYAGPKFSVTRYGNVIGSRGSVVPIWKQQSANGQPLTITSPDATRFWITLPQAVRFVERCLSTMQGNEVFVPVMPSVRVENMARCFSDSFKVVGMGPWEKLHERVIGANERIPGMPSPYSSDTNDWWLEGDKLADMVASV